MIFETASDQCDIIGQKRRGKAIALEPLIGFAVKGEIERLVAIDPSFALNPHDLVLDHVATLPLGWRG